MLKIYAKPGHMVAKPGSNRVGQVVRYIGRGHKVTDKGIMHAAMSDPLSVDESSDEGRLVVRLMSSKREADRPFYAADKETASALGVAMVPVKFADGEWVEDVKPAAKAKDGDK